MSKFIKVIALCLSMVMLFSFPVSASAVEAPEPNESIIDTTAKGSLTLYKYDLSGAQRDGVWNNSYVSTGVYDQSVNDTLGGAIRDGDNDNTSNLGNGGESYGYAVAGVEFSYIKIADIVQYSEPVTGDTSVNHVDVLYAIDKTKGADFLAALGLENGMSRFEAADSMSETAYHYQSDILIDALSTAMETNATATKNAMESYMAVAGGTAMPLTNEYGKSEVSDLDLGLYLFVETRVSESVSNCNPFLLSFPMSQVNGTNVSDSSAKWLYSLTIYPKNETSYPTLEKTLRESAADTGKNNGSADDITNGYAHTGTASDGDVVDYQIISKLPTITSGATYLSAYTFVDTLSAGLSYNRNDIKIEFYTDIACTDLITTWGETDSKFTVTYGTGENSVSTMTIEMTPNGLAEINSAKTVYTEPTMDNSGYSDCFLRITYQCTMHSDNTVVYGDVGNPNEVTLLWKRTSQDYYDMLIDDSHIFTYSMNLTKVFSDGQGDPGKVEFLLYNDTDDYYVKAMFNQEENIYYVTDHVTDKDSATRFIPTAQGENNNVIVLKGLEDDDYVATEIRTDSGYTLLRDDIKITISQVETADSCDIYSKDTLGIVQNDPRFADLVDNPKSIQHTSQPHMEHKLLTASAEVNGKDVTMLQDNDSANASVPLKVTNSRGWDLPQTGDNGTWMYSVGGILLMTVAIVAIYYLLRKKNAD